MKNKWLLRVKAKKLTFAALFALWRSVLMTLKWDAPQYIVSLVFNATDESCKLQEEIVTGSGRQCPALNGDLTFLLARVA
jgi:hypothetical protein